MIVLKNLSKTYKTKYSSLVALNDIALTIEKGEFVSIVGRSGCGKTTLLNIIGLIDTFDEGEYFFDGVDVKTLKKNELAHFRGKNIGFVFQSFHLLPELNCMENVGIALGYAKIKKRERERRARELLALVGMAENEKQYPNQLSGGQQQRIAIARAIAHDPSVVLADEPTGNLDYQNGLDVMALLQKLKDNGTTVVMVTHDVEFSRRADRILTMKDGIFQK